MKKISFLLPIILSALAICLFIVLVILQLFVFNKGVNDYKNINDLRNANTGNATVVKTLSYGDKGDIGGATYYYDPSNREVADNGANIIVSKDGKRWIISQNEPINLRQCGAVGDGSTDDTEAIKRWFAALDTGMAGYVPAGSYIFTEPLTGPVKNRISLRGDGSQQSLFVYNGEEKAADLLTFGLQETKLTGWTIDGIGVHSKTQLSGGAAMRLIRMAGGTRIHDVSFGQLNGAYHLWNGMWFDTCNVTVYDTFEINVKNIGIITSGSDTDDSASDLSLNNGTITFPTVGINAAGGFGGLYVGQVLVYGAKNAGYLQDNSIAKRGNREIILSDLCCLDAAHTYNVYINDAASQQSVVQLNAFITGAGWISPAEPGDGIFIEKLPNGRVTINPAQIKANIRHGVNIADLSTNVLIGPTTFITDNGEFGLNVASSRNVSSSAKYMYNKKGDTNKPLNAND